MKIIDLNKYKEVIKNERKRFFTQPYDLVYKIFEQLNYHAKSPKYFCENASEIVENLRKVSWDTYFPIEKEFTTNMLKIIGQ